MDHPHRVDRVCGYQRRGLLRSEVVGGFWGFLAMPPPIRGDCSNQSARRGRPGAMSPESAGGLGSWLVSGQSRQDARAASIDAVNRWSDGWVQGEEVIWWRGRFWRKDGCVWCPESDHFFRKDRKDGTFPRSLPHCAGCWSPARDEGASGSSSRYCGYSSIFRLGRSTPRFGMPTGDSCRPTGSAYPLGASASGHPLAAPPVLGWAPAPRTGQSGVDQDAPQGGPADGDTLALGQQLTEMRVVGTFVLRTSQPAGAGASGLSLPVGKDQSYPAQPGVGRRHHLLAHGPGIPLPGGHHGLAQPVRGGLAIVQQLGGRLLRRRPTRDTHYHIVACGKYYPSRIPKF